MRIVEKAPRVQNDILESADDLERTLKTIEELQMEYIGDSPSIGASKFTRESEDITTNLNKSLKEVREHLEENEGGNSYYKEFLPYAKRDYYQDLHDKHFDPSTAVGSVFTEAGDIEELLENADREEGGIRRDDRDIFIAEGADPDGSCLNVVMLK